MHFLNLENTCPEFIVSYILDLTSSYTDKRNESTIMAASAIMFVISSAYGYSKVFKIFSEFKPRLYVSSALSLVLPVMSYLFSEAKNASGYSSPSGAAADDDDAPDLSLRAGLILAWMLFVELLRRNVPDQVRMQSYSSSIQDAARVIWLGNLVFFSVRNTGRKALLSVFWILCATKLAQRIAFAEVRKRSCAHGSRNARLVRSYMSRTTLKDPHQHQEHNDRLDGDELLKRCDYIVIGEENLVGEPTADGYKVTPPEPDRNNIIVTVGKVWEFTDKDWFLASEDQVERSKRLCLSFALFKLLRQRFERLPAMTPEEAQDARNLILKGLLCNNGGESTAAAEALFQVVTDEVAFLSEYYHYVVPVALASPFFLFVNYFLAPAVVIMLCLMTVTISRNGDVSNAFGIFTHDLWLSLPQIVACIFSRAPYSPAAFFSAIDFSSTFFLFTIFFYEEISDFFVFVRSKWFVVSLLCNYIANPGGCRSSRICRVASIILWPRTSSSSSSSSSSSGPKCTLNQLSVLNLRWPLNSIIPLLAIPSLIVTTELVPRNLKRSIAEYLLLGYDSARLSNNNTISDQLERISFAEIILTWHVATSILEVRCAPQNHEEAAWSRTAIRVSKYCAYLVAFRPELLPDDNPEKAELVIWDVNKELRDIFGYWCYYFSCSQRTRVDKIMETLRRIEETENKETSDQSEIQVENSTGGGDREPRGDEKTKIAMKGAKLGRSLMAQVSVWKVLADMWTELIILVAPSGDEACLRGHEDVLAQGGEFITVLWALATHLGVTRPAETGGHATQGEEAVSMGACAD